MTIAASRSSRSIASSSRRRRSRMAQLMTTADLRLTTLPTAASRCIVRSVIASPSELSHRRAKKVRVASPPEPSSASRTGRPASKRAATAEGCAAMCMSVPSARRLLSYVGHARCASSAGSRLLERRSCSRVSSAAGSTVELARLPSSCNAACAGVGSDGDDGGAVASAALTSASSASSAPRSRRCLQVADASSITSSRIMSLVALFWRSAIWISRCSCVARCTTRARPYTRRSLWTMGNGRGAGALQFEGHA